MRKQQKVKLNAVCFPIARFFAVVLLFYNYLFHFKPCKFKNSHSFKSKRLHHTFLSCITHKYSAKFTFFQHTAAFICYFTHFEQEIFYGQEGEVAFYIFAVMNNIGIRGMSAN